MRSRYLVPGNLLLAGEYAVTETGGLGIAVGVARYVEMVFTEGNTFSLTGLFGRDDRTVVGARDIPGEDLVARAAAYAAEALGTPVSRLRGSATIDSRRFYDDEGRKLGLGSSAAVTVAVCAAVAAAAGMRGKNASDAVYRTALDAHRAVQNGRGSGYDVLASLYGGVGLVTGGDTPTRQPLRSVPLERIAVLRGSRPVKTTGALDRYESWRSADRSEHASFLAGSNASVGDLAAATDFSAVRRAFLEAKRIGITLGEAIGVPAGIECDEDEASDSPMWVCKALGAGNEIGGCISGTGDFPPGAQVLEIDPKGARWA